MCEKRFHLTFELRGMLQPSPSSSMLDHGQRAGDRAWMEPFFARPTYPAAVPTNIDKEGEGSAETTACIKKVEPFFAHTGPQKTCFERSPMPTGGQRRGQCVHAGAPHAQTELRPLHPNWGVARAAWGQTCRGGPRRQGRLGTSKYHALTELRPMHPNSGIARAAWGQASTTLSRSSGRYLQTGAASFSFDIHSHKMHIKTME